MKRSYDGHLCRREHFPRGCDQSALDDPTVAPVQLATATDDPVYGDVGKKSHFGLRDGRQFQVRYNEGDVSFPIVSIGEASQQGNWFVFGPGCQAMFPSASKEYLRTCAKDPNVAKLEKHRGVYWLPCSVTEPSDGVPLCPNPRMARLAIEAPPVSVPDHDATPVHVDESEETRRPRHKPLPPNVSKQEYDSRISRSGRGVITASGGKQWMMRTDHGLTHTEVKPRWVWITSSWQEQRIHSMRKLF